LKTGAELLMQLIGFLQMGTHVLFVFTPVAGGDAKHF
jgi:hypothetical protein